MKLFTSIKTYNCSLVYLLPPASEGWGKVIFSVCSHLRGGGGYPIPGLWIGGDTPSQVGVGDTMSQVWVEGYPIPGLGGGVYPVPGLWVGGVGP